MAYYQKQDYKNAVIQFHKAIFYANGTENDKRAARYYFGLSLMKLGLYQIAEFPLIASTQNVPLKVSQKAFERIVLIAEKLGDTALLNFTLKKLNAEDLSELGKELYLNLMAEAFMQEKKYPEAVSFAQRSLQINPNNEETLYLMGLIYLKDNKVTEGVPYFEKLYGKYFTYPATNPKRGFAALALGRAYYQAKRWNEAASTFREIPKDHPAYRRAQLELSWTLFRAAKFRSAMSTTQTLHTPFYENFYDPESLILRSIILLFVCQAEEADKALNTFQNTYLPTYNVIADINRSNMPPEFFAKQVQEAQRHLSALKSIKKSTYTGQVPFFVVRTLMDEAPLKNLLSYMSKLEAEKIKLAKLFDTPAGLPVLKYGSKILATRLNKAAANAGDSLRQSLLDKEQNLALLAGDMSLLRYEVLNSKKKAARSKYINKLHGIDDQLNGKESRSFYVSSGYRYWPFEGEYWRDEIGNYQYLGVNLCVDDDK
jgi:tetratricopeptide (TPR) repeat protein